MHKLEGLERREYPSVSSHPAVPVTLGRFD